MIYHDPSYSLPSTHEFSINKTQNASATVLTTNRNVVSRWIPQDAAYAMQQAFAPMAAVPDDEVFVPAELAGAIRQHLMEK